MKLIPLNKGMQAKVDDEDYDLLMQWKWNAHYKRGSNTYYAERAEYLGGGRANAKYNVIAMHRLIMNPTSELVVDHRDGDGLNNQRSNLRVCTRLQNCQNRRKQVNAKSKYKGVTWDNYSEKWRSRITVNGKVINIGKYQTEEEAAAKYNEFSVIHHKEFSQINILA